MPKKLRIVHVVSEVAPFSKTGGLGDVAHSLPKALHRLGHEVLVITPFYEQTIDKKKNGLELAFENVSLHLNSRETVKVDYWRAWLDEGLPVYFVASKQFFSKSKRLYGAPHENARFLVFDVAALKLISLLDFKADIIHCHDWQTGLIPYYLKKDFRYSKALKKTKSIFTIHNLIFQSGHNWWEIAPENKDSGRGPIPHLSDPRLEYVNFDKRAILSADMINTVSEQYREEIMTRKFGQDLDRILRNRSDRLFGIINGIDYGVYNPENDPKLRQRYSYKTAEAKADNKAYMQKVLGLPIAPRTPVACTTSRVTFQKGFEMIIRILPALFEYDLQLIVLGSGNRKYIKELQRLAAKHPDKLVVLPSHEDNQRYETSAYAGSDLFLLPSVHEPCGINQLIAMRYGCIPVVRGIGGLYDTVDDFDPETKHGTGFVFRADDDRQFYGAIVRALEDYKHKSSWRDLVKRAMKRSTSWDTPARQYVELYKKTLGFKN